MIKKYPYTDILGWSLTRYDKFLNCKRQYYYDYYGKYDTEYGRARIDSLKKMTSIPLEVGNVIHSGIKSALECLQKTGRALAKEDMLKYSRQSIDKSVAGSTFTEVYYKEIPAIDKEQFFKNVGICLDNYLSSERYQWILDKAVTNRTGWIIDPEGYGEARINGQKVYCKVDFLLPVEDKIYIIDWKTGKKDEKKQIKQLLAYTTWAQGEPGKSPENIVPLVVFLNPSDEFNASFTAQDTGAFISRINSETREMHSYCMNIEKNIPKNKEEFNKTDNSCICGYCNYRALCF